MNRVDMGGDRGGQRNNMGGNMQRPNRGPAGTNPDDWTCACGANNFAHRYTNWTILKQFTNSTFHQLDKLEVFFGGGR